MTWLLGWLGVAHAACTAITGATVHGPAGPEKGAAVVIADGVVAGVGKGLEGLSLQLDTSQAVVGATWRGAPCTFVQGAGRQLTAGLFAAPTQLGLVEVGLERGSRDDDPEVADPIRAALRAWEAYDPLSSVIAVQRIEGITTALTAPTGGFVAGQGAVVRLAGDRQSEAVIVPSAVMVAGLPSSSTAEGLRQLRELLADVRAHQRAPTAYDQGRPFVEGASRLDLEALAPVAAGRLPLLVQADEAADLEALVRLKAELGVSLVIVGAAEGWRVADLLAAAKIPVVVDPMVTGAGGFDQLHGRADNAALLHAAGVPLILTAGPFVTHHARTLRQAAGNAVRAGLPHEAALAAITATPAAVFGAPERGRIAVGAPADLALWSGDPLELSSRVEQLWIDGRPAPLRSRQTALFERYRELPGTPVPALPLPE